MVFSKCDPGPLGVPVDVFLAGVEAHLGRFDSQYLASRLKGEAFWDPKRLKNGAKVYTIG